jgi:hypothetical protein
MAPVVDAGPPELDDTEPDAVVAAGFLSSLLVANTTTAMITRIATIVPNGP